MRISDWSSDVCSSDLNADHVAVFHAHAIGQKTEVRLMHAEHVLHGLGCDADLLADQRFAAGRAAVQEMQRDVVCVIDVDTRNALGQRRERAPGAQRVEKLITERNDPGLWKCHRLSRSRKSRSEEHTSELQSHMRIS